MLNSRSIQGIIVLIVGLFLAIWLGLSIVTNQIETIIQVVSAAVLIVCLFLGKRIWLLIPFMAAIELGLRLPGSPTTLLLAQMLALGFSVLLLLMRKLPFGLRFTELEAWILIIALIILQAYLRNPVGLNVLGGGSVGGRPYVIFAITITTALLLCGLRVPIRELKAIIPLTIFGGLINLGVSILGMFIPSVAFYTGGSFVNTGETNHENFGTAVDTTQAGRILWLPTITRNVALWVASFISPLKACLHPLWLFLILFTLIGATFSGFRTAVITVAFTYIVGIAYRGGVASLLISSLGAVCAIALLAIINLIHPLPPNIQRALSFIPGTWNEQYTRDAEGSTDWRVEIWEEALFTDRWIKNKWIGDGLGFSARELAFQLNSGIHKNNSIGVSGLDAHRETIMANGDYHSTLVSGVRTAGYVGIFLLIIGTFRLAVHAHRLIIRYRRTEFYALCLMLGIPLVIAPVWLFIGANSFGQVASVFIMGIGMIRLLENNLPQLQADAHAIAPTLAPIQVRNHRRRSRPEITAVR